MDNIYKSEPAKILKIKKHTHSERSFHLGFKTNAVPGKFVMVSIPGVGEAPISISGFYPDGIELTIRNVGNVTSEIFKRRPGDYLNVRGPYGNTFPMAEFFGKHLLVIAGGSGAAAVKSLIEYFLRKDSCALEQLDILTGFRSPEDVLFKEEFKGWHQWSKNYNVILTVDKTEDEDEEWMGGIGFVVDFVKHIKNIGEDTKCVIVGPPLMITNTVRELFRFNVKPENVWLSLERHMKCGTGKCGHCRICDKYICTDGPVFNYVEGKELVD